VSLHIIHLSSTTKLRICTMQLLHMCHYLNIIKLIITYFSFSRSRESSTVELSSRVAPIRVRYTAGVHRRPKLLDGAFLTEYVGKAPYYFYLRFHSSFGCLALQGVQDKCKAPNKFWSSCTALMN
jgi:hypothetical protein